MIPFFAVLIASALAADSEIPPNPEAAPIQSAPKPSPRPPRARVSTTKKKKSDLGNARPGSRMPPAGSAATGGSSASPGGAPTTPYGSPY